MFATISQTNTMYYITIILIAITLLLIIFIFLAYHEQTARIQRASTTITPTFIESMISHHYPNVQIKSVTLNELHQAGDGKASTTDRISLTLTFISNPNNLIPNNVMLKTTLLPARLRIGGVFLPRIVGTLAAILRPIQLDRILFYGINKYNWYFPHAPDAMYINETRIYRQLTDEFQAIDFDTPVIYGTMDNDLERKWCILIEDLTNKVDFPNALQEHSLTNIRVLLTALARLHGTYWNSTRFNPNNDLAWIPKVHEKGNSMHNVFEALGYGIIRDHVLSNPFEQELLKPLHLTVEELWDGLQKSKQILSQDPITLCHGDAHVQNTYISKNKDGRIGMFDFQLTLQANWSRDISYLLGTSLSTTVRRKYENVLLNEYLIELKKHGGGYDVNGIELKFEEAKTLYSTSMAWGLVIGWLICPPNNYGVEILSANIRRLVAACVDLKTFEILLNKGDGGGGGGGCSNNDKID